MKKTQIRFIQIENLIMEWNFEFSGSRFPHSQDYENDFFPYLTPLLLVLGTHRSHKEVHGSFSSCAIVFCKNNICVNCIVDKCDIFMGRENCEEEIKCSVIIMYKSRLLIESNVV